MRKNITDNLKIAIQAALEAGEAILDIYHNADFEVEIKADNSPLTIADRKAHNIISGYLSKTKIPVLSEEGIDISFDERRNWEYLWIVDPLDGTKEFIKRNGEFTINIALVKDQSPILGVVYAPLRELLYFAQEKQGAFKISGIKDFDIDMITNNAIKLPSSPDRTIFTVVGSRSHMNEETKTFIGKLKEQYGEINIISSGSALKLCQVADGSADIYPRFAPTMEWDTAAGQAVVELAGGKVTMIDGNTPLVYNKKNLLNPYFIVNSE